MCMEAMSFTVIRVGLEIHFCFANALAGKKGHNKFAICNILASPGFRRRNFFSSLHRMSV